MGREAGSERQRAKVRDAVQVGREDRLFVVDHVEAERAVQAGELALDAMTSAVLMTHRLERDFDYLGALLATPVGYVGVIGSRQRAMQIRAAFPNEAARLHVPAGLDVGSETPREIALAVAAEILALRNGKSGRPLSATDTPIHA